MSVVEQFVKAAGGIIQKKSPPGWAGTVEAMKDHPEIDNPWALAWSMYGEGYTSHYKGLVEKFLDHAKCY